MRAFRLVLELTLTATVSVAVAVSGQAESSTTLQNHLSNTFSRNASAEPPNVPVGYLRDKTEEAEIRVGAFVQALRRFISEADFRSDAFSASFPILNQVLFDIASFAAEVPPCHELTNMLTFARHMFLVMISSSQNMRQYAYLGTRDQHLVSCMSELNVRLFSLYDSQGDPTFQAGDFAYKVNQFAGIVEIWKDSFGALTHVPFSTRTTFKTQTMAAEKSIRVLQSHIPVREMWELSGESVVVRSLLSMG